MDNFLNMRLLTPKQLRIIRRALRFTVIATALLLRPFSNTAFGFAGLTPELSGKLKTLNFFTQTTGFTPDLADNPLAGAQRGDHVFDSMERARLKFRLPIKIDETRRVDIRIDYDQEAHFGSFVHTGDFRLSRKMSEDRQFLDLSHTLADGTGAYYLHRLYRASAKYTSERFDMEIGRQQIPWGRGHFFTPTDVFNPFNPTQIELEERDGVDAVNLTGRLGGGLDGEFIYTPRGRRLHPQRIMGRLSKDIQGYEVGVLGGRYWRDHIVGLDFEGNLGGAALRGEGIFQEANNERDFFKYTLNMDYNFPRNILGLVEYHFNGEGKGRRKDYDVRRFLTGDIRQMARNYGAVLIQHDFTPLLKGGNRLIMNMDDSSFFVRPELQYEALSNLFLMVSAQLMLGNKGDEYDQGQNLYMGEIAYSF